MKEGKNTIRDVQPEISWLYGNAAKRGILKQITRLLWGESGHIFFVLSIYNKWWFAPYYKPYIYKYPSSDCAIVRLRESIPCELNNRFEKKTGTFLCVLSIVIRSATCTLLQAYIHKKSGRAFAYPQARESKPYVHKQETPPAYRKEHFTVSCAHLNFRLFACTEIS